MLGEIDTRLIALVVAVLVLAAAQLGAAIARRFFQNTARDAQLGVAQSAAFGVLALLLGFSFSVGLARYDARREVVVREANAIGTAWLRADLLEARGAGVVRAKLRTYAATRVAFVAPEQTQDARNRAADASSALRTQMWGATLRSADRRIATTNLVIAALNEMFDASAEQTELQGAPIPAAVLVVLIVVALIAALLLGMGSGGAVRREGATQAIVAVMLALVIGTIFDLDRPQNGVIRVDLEPLRAAQRAVDSR